MSERRLSDMRRGAVVVVTRLCEADESMLHKLLALGVVPGDRLRVRATRPVLVFDVAASSYAVDRELASRIFVCDAPANDP